MNIQSDKKADVLVAGGGIAGCAAALSAARAGLHVVLLERGAILGGLATGGLVNFFEPLCDGRGEQLIYGIAEEMMHLFIAVGGGNVPEVWKTGTEQERRAASTLPKTQSRYVTSFTPANGALALLYALNKAGVEVVLDALITEPVKSRGVVRGLRVRTANGEETFSAKVIIDATGSAEIFFRAGFPTVEGKNALNYLAHAMGSSPYERKWIMQGVASPWTHSEGERVVGTSREAVNRILQEGQLSLYKKLLSGELKEDIVALTTMPHFRTVRRIAGKCTITEKDANRAVAESLGVGGHFDKPGVWYELPLGAFVAEGAVNLVAAGRILSAEGDAWNAVRVVPFAALTGELAGLIAAASVLTKTPVCDIPHPMLENLALSRGLRTRFGE